ncbi:hypothetical protein roselon_02403 [Roseibacterium elongatum DSM 19469]|uniref:Uncharacterized protein n=1 Tax=Roseicyclus elongatus DSM 19469 TaxID=1294273 RepID=W8SQA4_9RHOB|nr:hypothetical protein [Roseibacterium elongatum]AHM04730.1 hypothetical protein roselon_02403 [Roseibacterium elongatum DSM 19469]
MARKLLIWALGLIVAVGGTAALLVFATSGATTFRVEDGTRLHVEGKITGASTERVTNLLEQHPGLSEVVLGDIPGTDDANWLLAIGYHFRNAGLSTRAVGTLDNDAILLWLAGTERRIDGGRFRVSDAAGARDLGLPFDRSDVAVAERRRFALAILGDEGFAREIEALRALGGVQRLDPDSALIRPLVAAD